EKLRQRERAESSIAHGRETLRGLLGTEVADDQLAVAIANLRVPDPGIAFDPHELRAIEDEIQRLEAELGALRNELFDRRARRRGALGVADLAALEVEIERARAALAAIDRDTRAALLTLDVLRELAEDVDLPLREALGNGPGGAGAYLAHLTGGTYAAV